jgi:hypothetical protein
MNTNRRLYDNKCEDGLTCEIVSVSLHHVNQADPKAAFSA